MDQIAIRDIERANPIIQIAIELGIRIQGSTGVCFHKDRHGLKADQFTLFFKPVQNSFFCKNCPDIGGSVVDLVCQHQGWDRETAMDWLVHRNEFDQMTRKLYYKT